jgi:hypothetical protein
MKYALVPVLSSRVETFFVGGPQEPMRAHAYILVGAVALGALSCGGENPAGGDVTVQPISIDSVDVLVMESSPPQVSARVRGVIGDGCSELHSVRQERSGHIVRITILRQRLEQAFCIQIARLYDEVLRLEGTYPPGRYVLYVNDVERAFTTQ